MKKIKDMLMSINFALLGFIVLITRLGVYGLSYPEAIAAFALSSLYGFNMHLKHIKGPDINEQLKKDIAEVKGAMSALRIANGMSYDKKEKSDYRWG